MLDRQKVEAILTRRFPGATAGQVAAAANAIMGLGDEWEELLSNHAQRGYNFSAECHAVCVLAQEVERGAEFRLFRRRGS